MSLKAIDLKEVKAIVDWVNVTEDVREFSLKLGELELFISRNKQAATQQPAQQAAPSSVATVFAAPPAIDTAAVVVAPAGVPKSELAADEVLIKAPMVGTFYAGPNPGAPNFVRTGDAVDAQTVLCIVEVMKLMNSIEAGVAGTVTKIFVDNERPVEYGQPLMIIKKHG
ncbi:MAG: acetyl-CoA carboxylase biotin carboxyl carrier protein [Shinella sp.]|uniref:acetyl-CoA carboxylase biotin carboxyl carrier protein n=1 Tax=Shinella sp. TaxID=1870904 RepID=UPI004036C3FF